MVKYSREKAKMMYFAGLKKNKMSYIAAGIQILFYVPFRVNDFGNDKVINTCDIIYTYDMILNMMSDMIS